MTAFARKAAEMNLLKLTTTAALLAASHLMTTPVLAGEPLDDTRPWFVKKGAPLCQDKEDLAAIRDNVVARQQHSLKEPKAAHCSLAQSDTPVVEIEKDGWLQPDLRVRLPNGRAVWTFYIFVRN
jgi:hypothetical protein